MRRQVETRVSPRMMRHMQEHTQLDNGYSNESDTETSDKEEETKDKRERTMNSTELREIIKKVELEVAADARVKHMETQLCNMVKNAPTKQRSVTGKKCERGLAMYCTLLMAVCENGQRKRLEEKAWAEDGYLRPHKSGKAH
jgi:hypothetical protein